MIDETIETPGGEVDIYLDNLEEMLLKLSVPNGMGVRIENDAVESRDIKWFKEVVERATDLDPENTPTKTIVYIVDCVSRVMIDKEINSYEEAYREDEETDFIGEGTLGVQ